MDIVPDGDKVRLEYLEIKDTFMTCIWFAKYCVIDSHVVAYHLPWMCISVDITAFEPSCVVSLHLPTHKKSYYSGLLYIMGVIGVEPYL